MKSGTWQHFQEQLAKNKLTVIIVTHCYVETLKEKDNFKEIREKVKHKDNEENYRLKSELTKKKKLYI